MKNLSTEFDDFQRNVKSRVVALIVVFLSSVLLLGLIISFNHTHEREINNIRSDPFSLGYILGGWLLSLLLISAWRAALDVQYSKYVRGRIDELIYLKNWNVLAPIVIVIPSLTWNYYSEPWSLSAKGGSIIAVLAAVWAVYQLIRNVSGVWLARGDAVFFYPNEELLDQKKYLSDEKVNQSFRDESSALWKVRIKVKEGKYAIQTALLLTARPSVFVLARSKGGLLFNEAKIRLCTDIPAEIDPKSFKEIVLQKTSYFDSLCTNDIAGYRIRLAKKSIDKHASDHDDDLGKGVEDLFLIEPGNSNEEFVKFGVSKFSNHLGGSTIAIDSSGYIHLTKQGRSSVIAAGKLTSTGSGSFDWSSKVSNGQVFCELIRDEIERELCEETGLHMDSIKHTFLLGMARHRARGGKPEFFAVTLVKQMQAHVLDGESGLTDNHYRSTEPLEKDPNKAIEQLNRWLRTNESICSSSLVFNLKLLTEDPYFLGKIISQIDFD